MRAASLSTFCTFSIGSSRSSAGSNLSAGPSPRIPAHVKPCEGEVRSLFHSSLGSDSSAGPPLGMPAQVGAAMQKVGTSMAGPAALTLTVHHAAAGTGAAAAAWCAYCAASPCTAAAPHAGGCFPMPCPTD